MKLTSKERKEYWCPAVQTNTNKTKSTIQSPWWADSKGSGTWGLRHISMPVPFEQKIGCLLLTLLMLFSTFKLFFKLFFSFQLCLHGSLRHLTLASRWCTALCPGNQQSWEERRAFVLRRADRHGAWDSTEALLCSNIYPSLQIKGFTLVQLFNKWFPSPTLSVLPSFLVSGSNL